MNRRTRLLVFDLSFMALCVVGACYAAAQAGEPVESKGWEGAKEALQQVKAEALPKPAAPALTPMVVCYRAVTLDTVQGPVGALALYLGSEGDSFLWPIDNAVGLSVTDAVYALGEGSVLADLDPAAIQACPLAEKVNLPAPPTPTEPAP